MWLLFSLLTAFCWALGSVILKPAYKKLSPSQIYLLNGISFFLILFSYKIFIFSPFTLPKYFFLLLPAAPPLAFITFIYAIKKGKVSIVSAISSVSIIISTTLAVIFLHESVSFIKIILTPLMVLSLTLLGLIEKRVEKNGNFKGFIWGIIAAIAFGVSNTLSKYALISLNATTFSIINGIWMIIFGFIWLILNNKVEIKNWQEIKTNEGKKGLFGAIIYSFGGFFLFLAIERGDLSLVIPISNLSVPLTLILSSIMLKEKVSTIQKILIGIIFLSVTGISLF